MFKNLPPYMRVPAYLDTMVLDSQYGNQYNLSSSRKSIYDPKSSILAPTDSIALRRKSIVDRRISIAPTYYDSSVDVAYANWLRRPNMGMDYLRNYVNATNSVNNYSYYKPELYKGSRVSSPLRLSSYHNPGLHKGSARESVSRRGKSAAGSRLAVSRQSFFNSQNIYPFSDLYYYNDGGVEPKAANIPPPQKETKTKSPSLEKTEAKTPAPQSRNSIRQPSPEPLPREDGYEYAQTKFDDDDEEEQEKQEENAEKTDDAKAAEDEEEQNTEEKYFVNDQGRLTRMTEQPKTVEPLNNPLNIHEYLYSLAKKRDNMGYVEKRKESVRRQSVWQSRDYKTERKRYQSFKENQGFGFDFLDPSRSKETRERKREKAQTRNNYGSYVRQRNAALLNKYNNEGYSDKLSLPDIYARYGEVSGRKSILLRPGRTGDSY